MARGGYAETALEHGWSRNVLVHHIELRTVERQGSAATPFRLELQARTGTNPRTQTSRSRIEPSTNTNPEHRKRIEGVLAALR